MGCIINLTVVKHRFEFYVVLIIIMQHKSDYNNSDIGIYKTFYSTRRHFYAVINIGYVPTYYSLIEK